ncbi:MAG: hypothetical protein H6867_00765 [Rhodospirillales bacterium]|nr:hypothetical protein [Rhodospirillales bacterium]MCB9996809.1 hypothetical protein [Rhodospirillales bacterium]
MYTYNAKIEQDDLVLTHIQVPSMEEGAISRIALKDLSEVFSVLASERGSRHIDAKLRRRRSDDENVMIGGVTVADLFNKVSGYKRLETLEVGVPASIVFDDIENGDDMSGSDSYIDRALTLAAQSGELIDGRALKIEYDGALPKNETRRDHHVYLVDTMILPGAVGRIEDKGAYRTITLNNETQDSFHTKMSKAELDKMFAPAAP